MPNHCWAQFPAYKIALLIVCIQVLYMRLFNLYIYTSCYNTKQCSDRPDELVQSGGDGGQLSDGVREELGVLRNTRVALYEALGEVVDEDAKRMISRSESLGKIYINIYIYISCI